MSQEVRERISTQHHRIPLSPGPRIQHREFERRLKGVDAHRVMLLGPIAEQLGFVVGLAGLSHKVSGSANDNGQGYPGRTLAMVEVFQKSTRISGIVDLAGASLLSVKHLNLSVKSLIPGNPFKNKKPDDTEYEGYMGNIGFVLSMLIFDAFPLVIVCRSARPL